MQCFETNYSLVHVCHFSASQVVNIIIPQILLQTKVIQVIVPLTQLTRDCFGSVAQSVPVTLYSGRLQAFCPSCTELISPTASGRCLMWISYRVSLNRPEAL